MNEFFLHEQLCALEGIAAAYPQGRPCSLRVREGADRIVSRAYRVAVIGEFKKGKSSLINALLGTEVLPTDISYVRVCRLPRRREGETIGPAKAYGLYFIKGKSGDALASGCHI